MDKNKESPTLAPPLTEIAALVTAGAAIALFLFKAALEAAYHCNCCGARERGDAHGREEGGRQSQESGARLRDKKKGKGLVRVLVNLLDNALRASAPDAAVELHLAARDDRLVLCVEDRGIGMSDDELARAFDPFTSFRPDGNGLGLSISRQAATSLRGTLRLERREGGGMRAVLEVPLPAPENTRPEAPDLSS